MLVITLEHLHKATRNYMHNYITREFITIDRCTYKKNWMLLNKNHKFNFFTII